MISSQHHFSFIKNKSSNRIVEYCEYVYTAYLFWPYNYCNNILRRSMNLDNWFNAIKLFQGLNIQCRSVLLFWYLLAKFAVITQWDCLLWWKKIIKGYSSLFLNCQIRIQCFLRLDPANSTHINIGFNFGFWIRLSLI